MFPISDDDSARRTLPVVTYALIALNILVFFIELNGGDAFIKQWAFVPSRFISNGRRGGRVRREEGAGPRLSRW